MALDILSIDPSMLDERTGDVARYIDFIEIIDPAGAAIVSVSISVPGYPFATPFTLNFDAANNFWLLRTKVGAVIDYEILSGNYEIIFTATTATGATLTNVAAGYNPYVVSVNDRPGDATAVADTASLTVGATVTSVVIDVLANDTVGASGVAPVLVSATVNPAEGTVSIVNGAVVYVAAVGFIGNATITYAIAEAPPAGGGTTDIPSIGTAVVTVTPNTAPSGITLSSNTVNEFAAIGTVVGTLAATDPNIADVLTYSLSDSASGRFSIANGNQLVVNNSVRLDYEQNASHTISVQVTDGNGGTATQTLSVTIVDVNPEVVSGTESADTIVGGALNDQISGLGGNDSLYGGAGTDTLNGGLGDDILEGGAGVDAYIGGSGNDAYYIRNLGTDGRVEDTFSELANDGIDGINTSVQMNLNEARYTNIENAYLVGTIVANLGGSAVNNVLIGNSAANSIYGLGGRDIMRGEGGADKFVYLFNSDTGKTATTRDLIQDFTSGTDKIDLAGMDANGAGTGNGTFVFLPNAGDAFTGVSGQLRFVWEDLTGTANDKTLIEGDFNGDSAADFQIELTGLKSLVVSDFVL